MNDDAPPSTRPAFDAPLLVRTNLLWVFGLLTVVTLGGFTALVATIQNASANAFNLVLFSALAVMMIRSFWALTRDRRTRPVQAHADARGITLNAKSIPRDRITAAYLQPRSETLQGVKIELGRWRSFILDVSDDAEGNALLEALELDPSRAIARFKIASGFENKVLRQIATIGVMLGTTLVQAWSFFHPAFYVWLAFMLFVGAGSLVPTEVTVGADGLVIRKRGRRRFIAFSALRAIEDHPKFKDAIVLQLNDHETVLLRASVQEHAALEVTTRALRARIEGAFSAFKRRTTKSSSLGTLHRSGQSASEWIAALRKKSSMTEYRVMAISAEQLWSTLEDPAASADDRAAALIALRQSLDEKGLKRARKEIEACAEPRLRVAFDAAIDEKDSELEAALDALSEDEPVTKAL